METERIKQFSFWKALLVVFVIILATSGITFGFLGLYDEGFIEGFSGLLIIAFILAPIFTFFIKWRRDYRLTGKLFTLNYKEIKSWQFLFAVLFFIFSIFTVASTFFPSDYKNFNSLPPIQINPDDWNPYGYYG
ncbi:MAG: hypothetical protein NT012_00800 [Candidatus Nealsonbacteria bacterium]|nr:hypothetical protein [Candidatus Nealsonbacteria bacterium]